MFPSAEQQQQQLNGPVAEVVAVDAAAGPLSDVLLSEFGSQRMNFEDDDAADTKRYLVQRWGGGTVCDMTGMERKVEVQVSLDLPNSEKRQLTYLLQFHCNTQSTDRIALIREIAICEYVLVVHTPRLCGEPVFLASSEGAGGPSPVNLIKCQPISSNPTLDYDKAPAIDQLPVHDQSESVLTSASDDLEP